jgi:hypothetical protein
MVAKEDCLVRVQTDGIELVSNAKDAAPLGRLGDGRTRDTRS